MKKLILITILSTILYHVKFVFGMGTPSPSIVNDATNNYNQRRKKSLDNQSFLYGIQSKELNIIHHLQKTMTPFQYSLHIHNTNSNISTKLLNSIKKSFHNLALMIHYSLSPKVLSPLLALIGWTSSPQLAASLTCFLCVQDMINLWIKLIANRQRPYPFYQTNYQINSQYPFIQIYTKESSSYSFPSAHTQFITGFLFCILSNNIISILSFTFAYISCITVGITRSYLGLHWPTDTLFGILLGSCLGYLWGKYDPFLRMRHPNPISPRLWSFIRSTLITGFLYAFITLSTNHYTYELNNDENYILTHKLRALVTIWTTLTLSIFIPPKMDYSSNKSINVTTSKLVLKWIQCTIGFLGLFPILYMEQLLKQNDGAHSSTKKDFYLWKANSLKVLLYILACVWTFLLAPRLSHFIISKSMT